MGGQPKTPNVASIVYGSEGVFRLTTLEKEYKDSHRFHVTVQKADFVNVFDGTENLNTQTESSREGEGPARLAAPQLGQVPALELHHDVVEPLVAPASDEATDVVFPCE
jgi:hypothetical protein